MGDLHDVENNCVSLSILHFSLPWWATYMTWILAISTAIISSYFVMLYGLKYGYQLSVDWLVSFFISFTQSVIVIQPVKVLVVVVLLTQILRQPVKYGSWQNKQQIGKSSTRHSQIKAHLWFTNVGP